MLILSPTAWRIAAGACNYISTRFPPGHDVPVCEIDKEWFADLAQREIHAAGGLAPGLTWTTDRPTRPGWYFLRLGAAPPRVREVAATEDDGLCVVDGRSNFWPLSTHYLGYSWAGPIAEPAEGGQ